MRARLRISSCPFSIVCNRKFQIFLERGTFKQLVPGMRYRGQRRSLISFRSRRFALPAILSITAFPSRLIFPRICHVANFYFIMHLPPSPLNMSLQGIRLFYEQPPVMSRHPKSKLHGDQRWINEAGKCIRGNTAF